MTDEPEPTGQTDVPEQTSGRDRLVAALTRPTRGQAVVAVLLALLGFAAAFQIRLTSTDDDFTGQRRQDLVELLDSLSGAADRAQTQIDDLEQTRNELRSSSQRRETAIEEGQQRLKVLRILAGTVPAVGPGVTIRVEDPENAVTAAKILNGIEELRDAGAEAIEINDTVRVVASTAFYDEDGVITVDGVALRAPYVIDAIGSSHTLSDAAVFPGGLRDEIEDVGGTIEITQADVVEVASLHTIKPAEYSQPTDE